MGCHFLVQRIFPIQGSNLCLLHWQADSFSTESPRKPQRMECACVLSCFSCVQLFVTQWTIAHQAPLSLGFSRQEYWSGLPCPPPGDIPDPELKLAPFTSPAQAGRFFTASATWEPQRMEYYSAKRGGGGISDTRNNMDESQKYSSLKKKNRHKRVHTVK